MKRYGDGRLYTLVGGDLTFVKMHGELLRVTFNGHQWEVWNLDGKKQVSN